MEFLDRAAELKRLDGLLRKGAGGLAVVYGRRRVGKTRLLLEWVRQHDGLYTVADQSAPALQRAATAEALAARFAGFADVEYPTWQSLLARLTQAAIQARFRGPIVFDELPYLVATSPELPSVLQRWVDHDVQAAELTVAIAGSSQSMMQGLVLSANAPLFGRARENIPLAPLPAATLRSLGIARAANAVQFFTAWGGIPRYWELAEAHGRDTRVNIVDLVLDPQGPLHLEPTRLLMEEQPPAIELKGILDSIGAGAHRVSEIAGRLGKPATSLARPLERLSELGLIRRETPFGEPERNSKRSLYLIADPFLRLWFRTVSARRALLVGGTRKTREALLQAQWPALVANTWEDLVRSALGRLGGHPLGEVDLWVPALRWWHGNAPEWDAVTAGESGRLLVAEAKWSESPFTKTQLDALTRALINRPLPTLATRHEQVERALCVPETVPRVSKQMNGVWIVTGRHVLANA